MISVMLSPFVITRLAVASGALWAAAGITAGMLRTAEETAPRPAAADPAVVLSAVELKADREPVAEPPLPFAGRWPVMATEPAPVTGPASPRHHVTHRDVTQRDRVCGERGRRWYTKRGGWRYWRCRR